MDARRRHKVGAASRVRLNVLLVASFVIGTVPPALAAPITPPQSARGSAPQADQLRDLWFVELVSPPAADGTNIDTLRAEKAAFRASAARAGVKFTERYAFDNLWNGLSVRINPSEATRLRGLDKVKHVGPVASASVPPSETVSPNLLTAVAMTGADIARNELGYTGQGVKVGIIDTGVDYDHPDLGGDGVIRANSGQFPNDRVVTGWDFVGDAYNSHDASLWYNPTPAPDAYPDDCSGHGTHVAGIVGANGGAMGVAPGVTLGAYRVFSCVDTTDEDLILAALERAFADGMDVINMSFGVAFSGWRRPIAEASDRVVAKGVVVVASAGNSGWDGVYSTGGPSAGNKVISVASVENAWVNATSFTVSPDNTPVAYVPGLGAPPPPVSGNATLARTGSATVADDACSPLPAQGLAREIAWIRLGACSAYAKARNAELAGAAAVVLYNDAPGIAAPFVFPPTFDDPWVTIPVVFVSEDDGERIDNRIAALATELTWTANAVPLERNAGGGFTSSFSSYGMTAELVLKPDVAAPGGVIRSTVPLEWGGYDNISGTSMAAPHVAGAAALLLQARPRTPASAVASVLMNSSDPVRWWADAWRLEPVHRQGAGLVDADDAILATSRIEPAKLSLGESAPGPTHRTLTIENSSPSAVTYSLSHQPAVATGGGTFSPDFFDDVATVVFSASEVTVPPSGVASVAVGITAPSIDRGQYGGYLVFKPSDGSAGYRVPYAGFSGDYQAIEVLTPGSRGFPKLARWQGFVDEWDLRPTYLFPSRTPTYTLQARTVFGRRVTDDPFVAVHFNHQAQGVRVQVVRASDGKELGEAFEGEEWPRSAGAGSFFVFGTDGTVMRNKTTVTLPDGTYRFKVSVLKPLGDDRNPAHSETWASPVFVIDRP